MTGFNAVRFGDIAIFIEEFMPHANGDDTNPAMANGRSRVS